jgi:hypothetical protein
MTTKTNLHEALLEFDESRMQGIYDGFRAILARRSNSLVPLEQIRQRLGVSTESYRGFQMITVDRIVGSENRYRDFSMTFRPKKSINRYRWAVIDAAVKDLASLPPIVVYEVGGLYFVRDGHHRVSVAKQQRVTTIEAEVYRIDSAISFSERMSPAQMMKAIDRYDRGRFYSSSGLPESTTAKALRFGRGQHYDLLLADVERHRCWLEEEAGSAVTFTAAAQSWHADLFSPFAVLAVKAGMVSKFRHILPADLYVWWIRYENRIEREMAACVMPEDYLATHPADEPPH